MKTFADPPWLIGVRQELEAPTLRQRDLLALGLWQVPPLIVVGYFLYEWLVANAILTPRTLGLFAAAYGVVRFFCRLMQLNIWRGVGLLHCERL